MEAHSPPLGGEDSPQQQGRRRQRRGGRVRGRQGAARGPRPRRRPRLDGDLRAGGGGEHYLTDGQTTHDSTDGKHSGITEDDDGFLGKYW